MWLALSEDVVQPLEPKVSGDFRNDWRAAGQHIMELLVIHTDLARLSSHGQVFLLHPAFDQANHFGIRDDAHFTHSLAHSLLELYLCLCLPFADDSADVAGTVVSCYS